LLHESTSPHSEEALELQTIALFEQLGYTTANCYNEICGDGRDVPAGDALVGRLYLGRETRSFINLFRGRTQYLQYSSLRVRWHSALVNSTTSTNILIPDAQSEYSYP
jgi:hypothetical protein